MKKLQIALSLLVWIFIGSICILGYFSWRTFTGMQKEIQQLKTYQEENQKEIKQLQSSKNQNNWIIAEVDYLVHLANYNLIFENDTQIAQKLLEAADQKLQVISDSTTYQLRKSLANDIANLSTTPKVDVAGIILRLNAISNKIQTLPLIPTRIPSQQATKTQSTPSTMTWREKLSANLQSLKDLVVIRRIQEPIRPLLSPEQSANLAANIQQQLSHAQWAVLHREPTVYTTSIKQAILWINQYYLQTPETSGILQSLQALQTINLKPSSITLDNTLKLLQATQIPNKILFPNKIKSTDQPEVLPS